MRRGFRVDRKERLGEQLRRLGALVGPNVALSDVVLVDSAGARTSAVDRAIAAHPQLANFVQEGSMIGGLAISIRSIKAGPGALAVGELAGVLDGVPRRFPFASVSATLHVSAFGPAGLAIPHVESAGIESLLQSGGPAQVGLTMRDAALPSGRRRALELVLLLEIADGAKPVDPPELADLLAALGKASGRKVCAVEPMATAEAAPPVPSTFARVAAPPADEIAEIEARYRREIAALVNDVAPNRLAPPNQAVRHAQGELKPTLVAMFKSRGYSCKKSSGEFLLRKRTPAGHGLAVSLDVGTWSRSLSARLRVELPGRTISVRLPPGPDIDAMQYPIGDTAQWQTIVENLAAVIDRLEATFVAEVGAVASPAPAWFTPE